MNHPHLILYIGFAGIAAIIASFMLIARAMRNAKTIEDRDHTEIFNSGPVTAESRDTLDDGPGLDSLHEPMTREDLRRLYHDLDLLTDDFREHRMDTTELLAVKRAVWRRIEKLSARACQKCGENLQTQSSFPMGTSPHSADCVRMTPLTDDEADMHNVRMSDGL